ncbi:MAG: EF-P beta-lysylation protein EpmB, partial [Lysobacter sp.]|nr:EF-P beta-lysylation protein EpmB [Lysobacter sp.]
MIPAAPASIQPQPLERPAAPPRWQALWRDAVRDPRELLGLLGLDGVA